MRNGHNSCFASTLVQNIVASGPMWKAFLECASIKDGLVSKPKYDLAFDHIQTMLLKIFNHHPGYIIENPNDLFEATRRCVSNHYAFGDSICPIEFLPAILQQLKDHDAEIYSIFDVLNFRKQIVSKMDCMGCGSHVDMIWSKLSDAIHPSLIGINPPVGDIKDLTELLKASMHDLEILLPKPLHCTQCNCDVVWYTKTSTFSWTGIKYLKF
jgi:hypothetical protein